MGLKSHPTKDAGDGSAIAKKTRKRSPASTNINAARTGTHADMRTHVRSRPEPKRPDAPRLDAGRKETGTELKTTAGKAQIQKAALRLGVWSERIRAPSAHASRQ